MQMNKIQTALNSMLILVLDIHAFEKRCGVFNLSLNPHVFPLLHGPPPPPLPPSSAVVHKKMNPNFFLNTVHIDFSASFSTQRKANFSSISHIPIHLSLLFINLIILLIVLVHGCNVDTGFSSTMTTCCCAHEAMFPASAPCG